MVNTCRRKEKDVKKQKTKKKNLSGGPERGNKTKKIKESPEANRKINNNYYFQRRERTAGRGKTAEKVRALNGCGTGKGARTLLTRLF